jgi:tRNA A-37 threonylcarbamoyl transferase component Bud32
MPALACGNTPEARWQVLADWAPTLLGPDGLRLKEWRARGEARVVKHGPHRTVYAVELADRAFHVKHYRCTRFTDVARHLVRASSARREWRKAIEVAGRGILTVRPIACQEEIHGGIVSDSYFVSETLPGVCSLEQYAVERLPELPGGEIGRARRLIIEGLARFVAKVHLAGIYHNDFHSGNVLLRPNDFEAGELPAADPSTFYLIDLPGVRFSGPLGWPASRRNLIVLNSAWWERTSKAERWRFWRTYLDQRPDFGASLTRTAVRQLEAHSRSYSRREHRVRDKRALRDNRDYLAIRQGSARAHSVRDLARAELIHLLDDPDALLTRNLSRPVKLERGSLIVQAELPLGERETRVIYKRYRPWNWQKALLGKLRPGRALRGWYLGHALLQRRIATARPVAVCDLRRPWYRCQSYLAIEWIEGSENLHLYAWRLAAETGEERFRRATRCAASLGALIGHMHARQVTHGDLKGSNLLVVEQEAGVQTYMVDTDGVRIADRLTPRQRAVDLARLAVSVEAHPWVSRTVHLRFLRAYAREFGPREVSWKSLWHDVSRRSRQITRRKQRRGEPVL